MLSQRQRHRRAHAIRAYQGVGGLRIARECRRCNRCVCRFNPATSSAWICAVWTHSGEVGPVREARIYRNAGHTKPPISNINVNATRLASRCGRGRGCEAGQSGTGQTSFALLHILAEIASLSNSPMPTPADHHIRCRVTSTGATFMTATNRSTDCGPGRSKVAPRRHP